MGNDRKIMELIYAFFLIVFSELLFPTSAYKSMHDAGYFMASRVEKDFHLMVSLEGENLIFYDKIKRIGTININDLSKGMLISKVLYNFSKDKKRFSIRIDEKKESLYIYSEYPIPDYIFQLKENPSKRLSPIEVIRNLDNYYLPAESMNEKLMMTLIYLGFSGCLSDKLFILYKEMLVIINRNGQKYFFGFDYNWLPTEAIEILNNEKEKYFSNRLLIAFRIYSAGIIFYMPGVEIPPYNMPENPLRKKYLGFFSSRRDTEIKMAAENDNYMKLVDMIDDKERNEMKSEQFSQIIKHLKDNLPFVRFFQYNKIN